MACYLRDYFSTLTHPTLSHSFSLNTNKRSADKRSFATSIILQVLKKALDTTAPGFLKVADEIATFCLQFDSCSQVSFLALRPQIRLALREMQQYTLIIDGLDKCEQSGESVMDLVNDLTTGSQEPLPRIIILSRSSDKLRKLYSKAIPIAMDESTVTPDIERFIAEKVHQYPILKPIHQDILEKARESCHGHFLWASTFIEFLRSPAKHKQARSERLQGIPDNLMEFYEELVNRAGKGKMDWELQLRREIFLLFLDPKRALTVNELEIALQFRSKWRQPVNRRQEDVSETILQLCWPLVSIIDEHAVLVHNLVEDFLTQTTRNTAYGSLSVHVTREESNTALAIRCLNVLSEDKNRDPGRISYWLYKNVYYEISLDLHTANLLQDEPREIVFYEYAARY